MASTDQARRARILTHMNKDHQASLAIYLRHYAHVSEPLASSAQLLDISHSHMLIQAGDGKEHSVPFTPPLAGWEEVRVRVVEMDATARSVLGISDVIITEYVPPSGFAAVVAAGVVFYFSCWATLGYVVPGTSLWNVLSFVYPGGPTWYRWVVQTIFWPVVLLHTSEAVMFDRTRMSRHGVPRWSGLWWKWIANCWIEGLTCWRRIDAVIERKKGGDAKRH